MKKAQQRKVAYSYMRGRLEYLFEIWKNCVKEDDYQDVDNFVLCFEYNEVEGYFSYTFGTGGPHDEVRFRVDYDGEIRWIEYFYADWNVYYTIPIGTQSKRGIMLLDILYHWTGGLEWRELVNLAMPEQNI